MVPLGDFLIGSKVGQIIIHDLFFKNYSKEQCFFEILEGF
jgi:hypothetical protein